MDKEPLLAEFQFREGKTVVIRTKTYWWVQLTPNGKITVPEETLKKCGVNLGDLLLSVRGSCLALSFIVKGPIIDEEKKHELVVFK